MFIDNANFPDLKYIDKGQGMPVLLLHGFCESKEIWNTFIDHLSGSFRVIAIDLPGFGDNESQETAITIADMAERIYVLLQKIGVEHSVLIGHSMGGYVALAFAEKFPHRVTALGLFHSSSFSDSIEKKQARNKTIDFIDRYGVNEFVEEFVPPLFFESRRKEFKDDIASVVAMGKKVSKTTVIETIKAMRDRKDRSRVLERADYPVLMIVGRDDIAVPFSISSAMFSIPKTATIHVLNNTGHMGMFEREDETKRMVKDFLNAVKESEWD